ncbi:hypothetical protein F0U59_38435 [Archangium gephyra]|nr:hypothetical protein F0U59_38435 [Archangium gephyra]
MLLALALSTGLGAAGALAQISAGDMAEQQRLANEANQLWWQSLSPREKQLVRAIGDIEEQYKAETGDAIPLTEENVGEMMRQVGASPDEAPFVVERMKVHARLDATYDQVDRFSQCANANPDWYMTGVCAKYMQMP